MAFLKFDGRTICYRLLGDSDKSLLLLAHPLGMSQGVWDEMLPALLDKFRVLTWDLPGHGASAAFDEKRQVVSAEDLALEAIALADAAGVGRFHFVGTSIGGVIGQQLLCRHSHKLRSAALTNTGAVIGTADAWNTRAAAVREKGLAAMAVDIVPRWFGAAACCEQPALVEGWGVSMGRGDKHSYALLCEMLAASDFRTSLGGQDVPLMLVGGSEDVATPPSSLQDLADAAGCDAPLILDQIGHVPSVECPAPLAQLLIEHAGNY